MIETEYKITDWKALSSKVLVVASVTKFPNGSGDWTAYIGAVAGECHEKEWEGVLAHGDKLSRRIASLLFPEFEKGYWWRD